MGLAIDGVDVSSGGGVQTPMIAGYSFINKAYPSASGSRHFDAAQTTFTMASARSASHTIFVQRVIVYIKTNAAQSITFQDSNGTPVVVARVTTSPGADTRWDFDFGPRGVPLTTGADLVASFSAAGLAGHMEWIGYQKS
jgi:hypothetical protein